MGMEESNYNYAEESVEDAEARLADGKIRPPYT